MLASGYRPITTLREAGLAEMSGGPQKNVINLFPFQQNVSYFKRFQNKSPTAQYQVQLFMYWF